MFVMIILAYAGVGLYEIFPLYKSKQKRELVLYSVIFTLAFILSLLLSLGVEIPSPADPIEAAVDFIIGK